jgi:hypothetical protein
MTANQINYQKLLEDIRTHKVSEATAQRQASAAERQASASERQAGVAEKNAKTAVANSLINESAVGAQWYGAQANAAYQKSMAAVSQANADTQRMAQEESARHNLRQEEIDLIKSGRETELGYYKTQVQEEQAAADREAAQTRTNTSSIWGPLIGTVTQGLVHAAPAILSLLG